MAVYIKSRMPCPQKGAAVMCLFVTYFFRQVLVSIETLTLMEKRKGSSESAEADRQYLGKFSVRHSVI